MHDYEKLGAFYLGRRYDLAANRAPSDEPLLYDRRISPTPSSSA
jgi:hypothetical protein